METLIPSTVIRSNTQYRIENEITGIINVRDVHDVSFEGGRLIGGYNLRGVNNGIYWLNQEICGGNIGAQVRSEGHTLHFIGCNLHSSTYAAWIRPESGGYVTDVQFIGTQVHNTLDDGIYAYKVHRFGLHDSLIHHVNMNWKPPVTDQKTAAGDGMQLILCDRVTIEGNTIDRSATGNKFCVIFAGSAGSNGTEKVPDNFIKINNNKFILPVKTSQGGAGLYFGDLPTDMITEFTFNEVTGDMAGIKYTCLGTFYSNGNTYTGAPGQMPIAIELQQKSARGESISDTFVNCTRKVSSNVQLTI